MMGKKGISVLIPTYNRPTCLRRALQSVLQQTRFPDEIIVLDDNPRSTVNYEAIKDLISKYPSLIRYEKNERNLGVKGNFLKALSLSRYEYVKFLADDDGLHPEALEKMEDVLNSYEEVVVVSSRRVPVNPEGEYVFRVKATEPLCNRDCILDGKEVIKRSLVDLRNYVGEFSTYMFRKSALDIDPFHFCGLEFRANADWLLWMYLVSKGKLFYFSQPLSFFTIHSEQDQSDVNVQLAGIKEKVEFILNRTIHQILGVTLSLQETAKAIENLLLEIESLIVKGYEKEVRYSINLLMNKYEDRLKFETDFSLTRPPFSVIVVTYNSESVIERFLYSLKRSLRVDDEVIIVDNNSQDDTVRVVESFIEREKVKNFRLLKMNENLGYAKAVNRGVELSSHDYLLFVNPDTVVPRNWSFLVYEVLKREEVGAVGALSNYVLSSQELVKFSNFAKVLNDEEMMRYVDLINKHLSSLHEEEEKKLLVGFFLATKKKIFEEVGKFDEDLFLGMDDLDFSLKLRERNYKLILLKKLFVYHEGHVSFKRSSGSDKLRKLTERVFADKLIDKYGFGNVPTPEKLWGEEPLYFHAFVPEGSKYKFMFRFSKERDSYVQIAREILKKPKVGIVTVTYYSSADLVSMAKSLKEMAYENFEWYIVDHSEDKEELDKVRCILKDFLPDRSFLFARENKGYAAGTNFGIEKALQRKCEYIWILNPDVVVEKGTLLELLKTVLFTGVPVVTCKMKDSIKKEMLQYDGFRVSYSLFPDYPQRIHRAYFLSGANIFAKADVFSWLRFDERYFLYFEDNDLLDKLIKQGIIPLYTPYTSVYHKNKGKTFLSTPIVVYYFFRNSIFFAKEKGDIYDLAEVIRNVSNFYMNSFLHKKKIRALISAIYDGVFGLLGKREVPKPPSEDKLKLLNEYLELRKISKSLALLKGRNYLLACPRDKEIFSSYLSDAFLFMAYSREKVLE